MDNLTPLRVDDDHGKPAGIGYLIGQLALRRLLVRGLVLGPADEPDEPVSATALGDPAQVVVNPVLAPGWRRDEPGSRRRVLHIQLGGQLHPRVPDVQVAGGIGVEHD